jgi:UDP-N-acetylglucosamine 2-epimerase (non-hydrolysing)
MILIVYGTRPEKIKCNPIINKLKTLDIKFKTLFTGQHLDLLDDKADFNLMIIETGIGPVNRLDSILGHIIHSQFLFNTNEALKINNEELITHVLVQGDTSSALAMALSAFHNGLKVIHLEAGLRTFDKQNPYPEEINRKLISQIADIHLCPTEQNQHNLFNEISYSGNIFVVGNTVIDNLLSYKDKCEYTNKILITLHRRENHHWIDQWFTKLEKLAIKYPQYEFIFPMHPNPNVQKHKNLLKNVNVIDPLPYEEMLNLLVKTRLVITDSGGLQEECSFFNKKCLTCRITTERPEAIGQSTFMISSPDVLEYVFSLSHDNYEINYECPFGDGHAAEKIVEILKKI